MRARTKSVQDKNVIVLTSKEDYTRLDKTVKKRICAYVKFAQKKVPYYQAKFSGLSIGMASFYKLPITCSSDLCKNPEAFIAEKDKIIQVASTGGTYNDRKLIFRTFSDIQKSTATAKKMFLCSGIRSNDKVAILQPFDLWNVGHIALRAFQYINVFSCPFGISSIDADLLWFLERLKLNIIYGTPSRVINIAGYLPQKRGVHLKEVLCAGEPITEWHRDRIYKSFGCEVFGIYGSEETDGIGAECKYHNGYHILDSYLIIELLNPTTLQPSNSKQGVLAVTNLDYRGTVLVRYLLDDIIELYDSKCPCGIDAPRLKILGRRSETMFLYDALKVPLVSIEDAMKQALGYLPAYQIIVKNSNGGSLLLITIKHRDSMVIRKKLTSAIMMSIKQLTTVLEYIKGTRIRIIFTKDTSSFLTTKRGKIPKIINRGSYGEDR
jgi:phenylacetate-CoA ligase